MKFDEFFADKTAQEKIALIKGNRGNLPNYDEYKKLLNVNEHKIVKDKIDRPDKQITDKNGQLKIVPRNRIASDYYNDIVNQQSAFAFGNQVVWIDTDKGQIDKKFFKRFYKILLNAKYSSVDIKLCMALKSWGEACEIWFGRDGKEVVEDLELNIKLRCDVFSPADSILYPYFDETGDLKVFARQYKAKDEKGEEAFFLDVYTDEEIVRFSNDGNTFTEIAKRPHGLKKIPVVYVNQSYPAYIKVKTIIERLELLQSNLADTNDYHGSPTIIAQGKVEGFAGKGEAGRILEIEQNAKVSYLSYDSMNESLKFERETLEKEMRYHSKTVDLSLNNLKGIGNISGRALKTLFTLPHLQVVLDSMLIYTPWMERRANIIKDFLSNIDSANKVSYLNLQPFAKIQAFMVDDLSTLIEDLSTAVGGKQIMSIETAVQLLNQVEDTTVEIDKIINESNAL
jgi:SPP1 family phage portal protein